MSEKSILEMVGGEKHINPHYNIKAEKIGSYWKGDKRKMTDKTFFEWYKEEKNKDKDNIFPPPLDAQLAIYFLKDYLLGENWYSQNPISTKQINVEIVSQILFHYSRRYRKELKKYLSEVEK